MHKSLRIGIKYSFLFLWTLGGDISYPASLTKRAATAPAEQVRPEEPPAQRIAPEEKPKPQASASEWQNMRHYRVSDGIAVDSNTHLMWMRCALGQRWDGATCQGDAETFTFAGAQAAARQFNQRGGYGGYSDWRVPTVRELFSLVECSAGFESGTSDPKDGGEPLRDGCRGDNDQLPTLDSAAFPNTSGTWFWTSSPYVGSINAAWYVYFSYGVINVSNRYNNLAVRLVRASQ